MKDRIPLRERFLKKVRKTKNCWVWTAFKHPSGYGMIGRGGRCGGMLIAHRAAYELFIGSIPKGMDVLHKCDNKLCVNPDHLFLGTDVDNSADMVAKGRQARGERIGISKLTWQQVREIREQYQAWSHRFGSRALGRQYGVNHSTIVNIIKERTWK